MKYSANTPLHRLGVKKLQEVLAKRQIAQSLLHPHRTLSPEDIESLHRAARQTDADTSLRLRPRTRHWNHNGFLPAIASTDCPPLSEGSIGHSTSSPVRPYMQALLCLLLDGMRLGYARKISKQHVDVERLTATFAEYRSVATYRLSAQTVDLLMQLACHSDTQPLFGGHLWPSNLAPRWQRMCRRAGVDGLQLMDVFHHGHCKLASEEGSGKQNGRAITQMRSQMAAAPGDFTDPSRLERGPLE